MRRVYEKRVLHGYGIYPSPILVTEYPDSATITIDIQASGTDEYGQGVDNVHLLTPKVINIPARYAALRGRRW